MTKTFFAVGSRKNATAKVWLVPEQDQASVNDKTLEDYFGRADLVRDALAPLKVTGTAGRFGMKCRVHGGGHSAQATAISLGAARALVARIAHLSFRSVLGSEDKPEYHQDAPELAFQVSLKDKTLDYRLSKPAEGDQQVLEVSEQPYYFGLSQYSAEDLTGAKRADLIEQPPAPEAAAEPQEPGLTGQAGQAAATTEPDAPASASETPVEPEADNAIPAEEVQPPATGTP